MLDSPKKNKKSLGSSRPRGMIWVIPSWVLAEVNSNVPSCVPGEAEDLKWIFTEFSHVVLPIFDAPGLDPPSPFRYFQLKSSVWSLQNMRY